MARNNDDDLEVGPNTSVEDFTSNHSDFNNNPKQDSSPSSLDEIRDMFKSAKDDLINSKYQGIDKDDLDKLHSHEAANMWTSLFMNFIGAAGGGVDATPYTKPLQTRLEQERQGLILKNQLANQQAQRAAQEQNFGMGQMKADQAMSDQDRLNSPLTPVQQRLNETLSKFTGVPASNIQTQREFEQAFPQFSKLGQLQNERQLNQLRQSEIGKQIIPMEDGRMGIVDKTKSVPTLTPIEGSISTQISGQQQKDMQNFAKQIKPETLQSHVAVQNYDTALDGLKPDEAKQADDLARRQIGAIAGKFDQGVKANIITNTNQLLNSIAKLEQTSEFNTPSNPAIGQAAFRRVKSALEFAASTQSGKVRPSNFATQFSLGNSFGANLAGQPVPSEKIEELKNEAKQGIGANIQNALSSTRNKKMGLQALQDMFGDSINDYLGSYQNIRGPGDKGGSTPQQNNIMQSQSLDDYLQRRGN